jgi:ribonuclease P protein component
LNGFHRNDRLISKSDYDPLFEKSNKNKISRRYFLILFKSNARHNARLGLVIAKRHIRYAVMRNQIKRIARESFRLNQKKLLGLDIIFMAKKACSQLTKQQLREQIELLWKELSVQALSLS